MPTQKGSVIINSQTGNEWVIDVIPGRNGPENLRILRRQGVYVQPLKQVVGFFGSDEIRSVWVLTSRDKLKS